MKVLIVDDDRDLTAMLAFALRRAGIEAMLAYDGDSALRFLREQTPDMVILDINLGPWNGFDLLRDIRRTSQIPVLVLSARDAEDDKVHGFDLGADDYITKPFGIREFIARVYARARPQEGAWPLRPAQQGGEPLWVGPFALDPTAHTASKDGQPLDLAPTEFRLFHCLMAHAGAVVPTGVILKQVWGYDLATGTDLVRVTAFRLRRKIEDDPLVPHFLRSVAGVGIMLMADPSPAPAPSAASLSVSPQR